MFKQSSFDSTDLGEQKAMTRFVSTAPGNAERRARLRKSEGKFISLAGLSTSQNAASCSFPSCSFLGSCDEKEWLIIPELDATVQRPKWILADHFA